MKNYRILDKSFQLAMEVKADNIKTLINGTVIFYEDGQESMILAPGAYGAILLSAPKAESESGENSTDSFESETASTNADKTTALPVNPDEITDEDVEVLKSETAKLEEAKNRAEEFFKAKRKFAGVKIDFEVLMDKAGKINLS